MAISSLGFSSGIDFDSIISQLIITSGKPLVKLQEDQLDQELKNATILNLKTKLSSFESTVNTLNSLSQFNTRTASITKTSTGEELVSVSADETALAGTASIKVNQLARASKKASQGIVDQDATAISSVAGTLKFRVGAAGTETTVNVSTTTTLEQLRDLINTANAGVTASIINDGTGSNPFRLVLTADSSGSANNVIITNNDTNLDFQNKKIEDVFKFTTNTFSGTAFSNSGNFFTGTENKTFLTKITTGGDTTGALASRAKFKLSTDGGITFGNEITVNTGGVDGTADIVIDSTNNKIVFDEGSGDVTATITSGTFTATQLETEIKNALEGADGGTTNTFTVSFSSATGKFTITNDDAASVNFKFSDANSTAAGVLGFNNVDSGTIAAASSDTSDFLGGMFIDGAGVANSTNGGVKLIFGTAGTLALDDKFSVDGFNPEQQAAQDAVIEVDNSTITKSSNTITDIIQGVTLNLLKADSTSTLTLTVSKDASTAKKNIEDFVDAFNVVAEFLDDQLSFDPEIGVANPLLGDFTLQTVRRKIGNIVTGTIPGVSNASFNSLSSIGITSDATTGVLSIDDSKLSSALDKDPDAVSKLFVGLATPTDSTIKFESKTLKTLPGTFSVTIGTAPEQATFSQVAKLSGGADARNDLSTTGIKEDEFLVFLFSKNNTETSPDLTTASITLKAGSTINTIVNDLNSLFVTKKIELSASNDNGKLEIKSTAFGKDIFFQVSTDKDDSVSGGPQILQDINGSGGETLKDSGVDIKGFINNHVATGLGNVLTGAPGFPEEGLVISTKSSATGGKGTITVSSGIADQLSTVLDSFTNDTDGFLKTKTDSIQVTIDDIKEQQDKLAKKLEAKEEQLRAQFTRLEALLAEFKATSDFLTSQLANLPKLGTGNS